ncbi:MAG: fibronectin type III domain-containing protein [Acidimicrobiales bacterium]
MTLSRRSFLRSAVITGAATTVGGSLLRAPLANAKPNESPQPTDPTLLRVIDGIPGYAAEGVPRGLQLSFSLDPASTRTVTWLTSRVAEATIVQWGVVPVSVKRLSARHLTFVQRGTAEPAPFGYGDEADLLNPIRDGGEARPGEEQVYVHRAVISGVEPGQRIAYRVGDGNRWSPIQLTRGGPNLDDELGGFRFTHVGDHGTTLAAQRTTRAMLRREPDWHLFAGDIS